LSAAEDVNKVDPGSQRERDLAFIALRRAQAAMADGNARAARRDAQAARDELSRTTQDAARALESSRAEADAARAQAEAASEQARTEAQQRQAAEQDAATARLSAETIRGERDKAEQERNEAQRERDQALAAMRDVGNVSEKSDRTLILTIPGELMFRANQAALLPRAKEKLDDLAEALQQLGPDQTFVIEGHTDARGSASYNRRLSRLRAMAVRSYLIKRGVDPDMVQAVGRGEDDPVASNATAEGRANNRRVEIIVSPAAVSKR
jgi:outer membrane protein OmpA-like peptidoglycan-associated protein